MAVREVSTFASGSMTVTVTSCPTQQKWFGLFLQGAKNGWVMCLSVINPSARA